MYSFKSTYNEQEVYVNEINVHLVKYFSLITASPSLQ